MEGKTLKKELLEYFDYSTSLPTASSLVQRRSQIKPEALKQLFDTLTKEALENRTDLSDFLFLAIDGSEFFCFGDPDDADTRVKFEKRNGYNALHLNGLYDLEHRVFLDAVVQPIHKKNEHLAAQKMIDGYNLPSNAVVIMDRGYACYNTMAHVEQKGLYYLIRAKDITSCSIVSSLKDQLPEQDCFDVNVHFFVTKKRNKLTKDHPELYKRIRNDQTFDYLTEENPYYEMNLRIVRIKLSDDSYECLLTNLPQDKAGTELLKAMYFKRWGIETSFRELKYAIGLASFHSEKYDFVLQEIWARLLLYNYCEMITTKVAENLKKKTKKHVYQLNYTNAIFVCRRFFRHKSKKSPFDAEKLIKQELLPIRPDRRHPRKVKARSFISFLYRIA